MSNAAPSIDPEPEVDEIPLPPDHIRAEMIAEENAQATASETAAPKAASKPAPEIAQLDFVRSDERRTVVPLSFAFRLDGALVDSVTVRRLNGYEIAAFAREHLDESGAYDRYELYSVMTGLPAAVLRGLDQDDGVRVTGACSDFLSRGLAGGS